jgi:hypothetical protein
MNRRSNANNWGTAKVRNTVGGRRAAIRVVMDNLNGMIVVYEHETAPVEGSPRNLVFESTAGGVIRLDVYPEHWRRMSDEALLALRYPHA